MAATSQEPEPRSPTNSKDPPFGGIATVLAASAGSQLLLLAAIARTI
jgi:hypothetical protein